MSKTSDQTNTISLTKSDHHLRSEICKTRAKYRQGRKETAVKVYTINEESKYVLIHNVHAINLEKEVTKLCEKYGPVESVKLASDYPSTEAFTDVYVVKFKLIQNAIYAKKKLDDLAFMGTILHVCYAPELETVEETKEKLDNRLNYVNTKMKRIKSRKIKRIKLAFDE